MNHGNGREDSVAIPAPGTALMVDLRNFTHQLDAAATPEALQEFCTRLAAFYAMCREAAYAASPVGACHLTSTGDGMLAVFHGARHAQEAFLCTLILRLAIPRVFPLKEDASGTLVASFGIGVESGDICRVMSGGRATYIGQCINMASRVEAITKNLDSADCIVGEKLVGLLYNALLREDFAAMSEQAIGGAEDREHLNLLSRFSQANHTLCLNFLHYHRLKGVDRPIALHGISKRAGLIGNPRFDALLETLCSEPEHHAALRRWLLKNVQR